MKESWTTFAIVVLAIVASATARAGDPAPSNEERLKESLTKWEKARQECEGNYSYVVRWASAFGFGNQTTVSVKGNKVVERKYETFDPRAPVQPGEKPGTPKVKWLETGKDLGSHAEGTPGRTVDEMYAEAKKILEAKLPANHSLFIGFDAQGVLNHCLTVNTKIADDSPTRGIQRFQLQLAPKK